MQKHDGVTLADLHVRHLAAKNPPPLLLVRKSCRGRGGFTHAGFTHGGWSMVADARTCWPDLVFRNHKIAQSGRVLEAQPAEKGACAPRPLWTCPQCGGPMVLIQSCR